MPRAIVSRKTLDALIRAKIASLPECPRVEALPVTWRASGSGCNWTIPGWVGDAPAVAACIERISHYLEFLREQFDIAQEEARTE